MSRHYVINTQAAQAADSRMPWLVGTTKRKPGTQEVST
jgi:hypothetical protein